MMTEAEKKHQDEVTDLGNPAKPVGQAGEEMLDRMNEEHYEVTGWALSLFHWRADDKVLDIGCGGGRTLHRMSAYVPEGHLTGVDYSEVSVQKSRDYNKDDIAEGKMEIIPGNVEALPFEEDQFDRIITVESFYFWPNPVKDLSEVRRVLKAGGQFILTADIYGRDDLPEEAKEHIRKYHMLNPTPEAFRSYFEQAGFQEIQLHFEEGTTWIAVEGTK